MLTLKNRKPKRSWFRTEATVTEKSKKKPIVFAAEPKNILMKLLRHHDFISLPWEKVWELADHTAKGESRVWFKTQCPCQYRGGDFRTVMYAIEPQCLVVKWEGTKEEFRLPWNKILTLAVTAHGVAEANRRKAERSSGKPAKPRRINRGLFLNR